MMGTTHINPVQMTLPDMDLSQDYITKIECGKRTSALVSHMGEIWMTGNYKIEKVKVA